MCLPANGAIRSDNVTGVEHESLSLIALRNAVYSKICNIKMISLLLFLEKFTNSVELLSFAVLQKTNRSAKGSRKFGKKPLQSLKFSASKCNATRFQQLGNTKLPLPRVIYPVL